MSLEQLLSQEVAVMLPSSPWILVPAAPRDSLGQLGSTAQASQFCITNSTAHAADSKAEYFQPLEAEDGKGNPFVIISCKKQYRVTRSLLSGHYSCQSLILHLVM